MGIAGDAARRLRANLRAGLADAADELEAAIPAAFARGDSAWADLAILTQVERAREGRGPNSPKLVRRGSYRASFKGVSGDRFAGVGSDDARFELLNDGGVNERGFEVPARPVEIDGATAAAAVDALTRRLTGG